MDVESIENRTDQESKTLCIIIPFFNIEGKFNSSVGLRRLTASPARSNVEVVMVNDGSTDGTLGLLESLATELRSGGVRTVVIDQESRGPGGARNAGFRSSNSKYVWFADGDDHLVVDNVLSYLGEMDSMDADCFAFDVKNGASSLWKGSVTMSYFGGEYLSDRIESIYKVVGDMFKSSMIRENKMFYADRVYLHEDSVFVAYLAKYVESVVYCPQVAYVTIETEQSLTRSGFHPRVLTSWETARLYREFADGFEGEERERIIGLAAYHGPRFTWRYLLGHGQSKMLAAMLPSIIAASRDLGLLNQIRSFRRSLPLKQRLFLDALLPYALVRASLIKDGMQSIRRYYDHKSP